MITPLSLLVPAYSETGTLAGTDGASIDWIEFTFFNTESHPDFATDFYIRSLQINGRVPEPGALALWAAGAALVLRRRRAIARTTKAYG